jgi:hypothetical protein
MKPSKKSEAMENFLTKVFGVKRTESIKMKICVTCGAAALNFRDPLSLREYTISGMCQKCQDEAFGTFGSQPN